MFVDTLNEKAEKLRVELTKAEQELAAFNALTEEQKLATVLFHEQTFRTYESDWSYEGNDWTKRSHQAFLAKAQALLEVADYDTNIKILRIR
jgi:hypothetical protein